MSMESTDRGFSLSVLELATLKGRTLRQCALRPDGRQLRVDTAMERDRSRSGGYSNRF